MTLQEKIQNKAEGFGKLAPVFLEGANFALNNQWINVEDDLPCNHEDMYNMSGSFIYTNDVLALDGTRPVIVYMIFNDKTGEWKWNKPLNIKYWFSIPKLTK